MKKKVLALLLMCTLTGSMLSGCGSKNAAGDTSGKETAKSEKGTEQVLRLSGSDPVSLDTLIGTDGYSVGVLREVGEGLGRIVSDKEGHDEIEAAGAESWEMSEDGLKWTFHLRDHKWSDGEPVRAQDYVYAFQRMFDKNVGSSATSFFLSIQNAQEIMDGVKKPEELGVTAPDDKTVVFTLNKSVPYFEMLIGMPAAFPQRQDIVEEHGEQYGTGLDTIVYNGPFVIDEWTAGSKLTLKKNDTYWDKDSVKLDRVEFLNVEDETAAMTLLKNGGLDAYSASAKWEEEILADGNFELVDFAFPAGMRDIFNVKTQLLESPKVRLALTLAKDREEINETLFDGYYTPAYGWVMPAMSCQGINFREEAGDPLKEAEKANPDLTALYKEGLKESGLDPEKVYTLHVLLQDSTAETQTAGELYKNQIESALPIEIELETCTDNTDFYQRRSEGNFEMTFLHMNGAEYDDPSVFLNMYLTGVDANEGFYSNAEYDELIRKAENATDAEERLRLFIEAEKILLVEDPAISPTLYWGQKCFISKRIENLMVPSYVPLGAFEYKYASIGK